MRKEAGRPVRQCCSGPHGAHGGGHQVIAVTQVRGRKSAQANTSNGHRGMNGAGRVGQGWCHLVGDGGGRRGWLSQITGVV